MQEDGVITAEQKDEAFAAPPKLVAYERPHRDSGFHFVDFLGREAKIGRRANLTAEPYTVHSTINADLQREAEAALQEGLAHYEIANGRMQYRGPEANIADAMQKLRQQAGANRERAPAAGVATGAAAVAVCRSTTCIGTPAVVLDKGGKRGDGASASVCRRPRACRSIGYDAADPARVERL